MKNTVNLCNVCIVLPVSAKTLFSFDTFVQPVGRHETELTMRFPLAT